MNYNDKTYNAARRRGYITFGADAPEGWERTFVGAYIKKNGSYLKELDILCQINGQLKGSDAPVMVEWSDITKIFLEKYKEHTLSRMCSGSARTQFATLKGLLNYMKDEVELPYAKFADILVAKAEPTQNVYLTEKELDNLYAVDTKSEEEKYVKSIFLICSYVGCRHSDGLELTEDNIQDDMLSYISIKTSTEATIPVHRNLVSLLNGYDRSIEMNDCDFNDILRVLCHRANITSRVKVHQAGKDKVGNKYEFVASHTARRSFVTNLYLRGVDLETIAELAGHSDSNMTRRYLCAKRGLSNKAMQFFN